MVNPPHGAPLPGPPYPPPQPRPHQAPPQPVPPTPRKRRGCLGGSIVLLLLLLGGGLVTAVGLVGIALIGVALYAGGATWLKLELARSEVVADVDRDQTVARADQIAVTIPFGALKRGETLTISQLLAPPPTTSGRRLGTAYDVSLGDQHEFDEELEIALDLDALGTVDRKKLTGLTYDATRGRWEPAPAWLDERAGKLRIYTTHLSGFGASAEDGGVVERSPMATVSAGSYPTFSPVGDADEAESILTGGTAYATKAGWDYAQERFGFASNALTLAEDLGNIKALGKLNELVGNLGLGFAMLQLAIDLAEGEDVRGVMNATKSIGYYHLGTWGTSAMKIASVGVFAIDYSLNKFATEALAGRYAIYEKAYAAYYKDHRRSSVDWLKKFQGIASSTKDPDAAAAAMMAEVDRYTWEFWENEENVAIYQGDAQNTGWSGGGGLNDKVKKSITGNYKAELAPIIEMVIARMKRDLVREQAGKVHDTLKQMAGALNRVYTIRVRVKSDDPERKLDGLSVVIPVGADQDKWQGATDAKGEWSMQCTALGYLMYGAPQVIRLTVPSKEGPPEVVEQKLELTGVVFELAEAAGTYEGKISGSHRAQGIDGGVTFSGPITIVVAKDGAATVSFSMPLSFSGGGGLVGVKVTATGEGKGTVKGGELKATAAVKSSYSTRSAYAGANQSGTGAGSVELTGTIVTTGGTPEIRGKMRSPQGGPVLDFNAVRKAPRK